MLRHLGKVRQLRGIVATDWEDNWEYRECIYYNNRRDCCRKRGGMLRHLGKVIAAIEGICCDR